MSTLSSAAYAEDGAHCPDCGSHNIDYVASPLYPSPRCIVCGAGCMNCGARWDETYTLSGYTELVSKPKINNRPTNKEILKAASDRYCTDEVLLGDPDDDLVSNGNMFHRTEEGTWVRAWLWVPFTPVDKE